jgi:hypothetical protein
VKYHKGQVLYLAGIAEFEGQSLPAVIPAKVATVNPQKGGQHRYNVHVWEPVVRWQVGAKYNCPEADLHACPIAAMEKAIEMADTAKAGAQKTGAANG